MAPNRNDKHVTLIIALSFIITFVINLLAMVIYPPDLAGVFPVYSMKFVLTIQVSGAFLLIALIVVAMKAEEEKQILPAAGFTAQAIS